MGIGGEYSTGPPDGRRLPAFISGRIEAELSVCTFAAAILRKASVDAFPSQLRVWFQARWTAAVERSLRIARRPARATATPVIPEPQNGSRTTSPGLCEVLDEGLDRLRWHLGVIAVRVVERRVSRAGHHSLLGGS